MKRLLLSLFAVLALGSGLAACGDDDDEPTVAGDDFCEGYLDLTAGEPDPETIREVAASAPGDAKEALEAIADGAEEDGEAYFEGPDFGENFQTVGKVAADECADETFEVTAKDYVFEGVPESVGSGILAVEFTNEGKEFHEFVVFRKADGVEQSFDDIFELGEEESEGLLEEKGGTFAEPGSDAPGLFSVEETGDYVAVCFIPVGSTPDNEEADGPPHFTRGMKVEFSVE